MDFFKQKLFQRFIECVAPKNIHTPPPPTEGNGNSGGWGCHRHRNFKRRGVRDVVLMNFFQAGLNFLTVVRNVSLFALSFSSHERKKINLANLKHKMNIFVLVRLDILSPQESSISWVAARDRSACCGKQTCESWLIEDICLLHLTKYFCHSYLYRLSLKISSHFKVVVASVKNSVWTERVHNIEWAEIRNR